MGDGVTRRQSLALMAATAVSAKGLWTGLSAEPLPAAPYPRMRRGMNFHHLLNWPETVAKDGRVDYVWPPFATANYQIGDEELRRLKSYGFDFIRLTADPTIFMTARSEHWAELANHVRAVISRLNGHGFAVIFDLHPVTVNSAYSPAAMVQAGSPAFAAYLRMVGEMASVLKAFPPDRVVLELMNEPDFSNLSQADQWWPLLLALHGSARAAAPDLPLLVEGVPWGDRRGLFKFDMTAFRGSNVLYSFHYYDPHIFTHQGVKGDDGQFFFDLPWPARADTIAKVYAQARQAIAAAPGMSAAAKQDALNRTKFVLDRYESDGHDAARIRSDFEEVARWVRKNAIPLDKVVLGEFGCVLASNGRPLGEDRLKYLAAVRQTSEDMGFPWAFWAYKGYGGMEFADSFGHVHTDLLAPLGLNG